MVPLLALHVVNRFHYLGRGQRIEERFLVRVPGVEFIILLLELGVEFFFPFGSVLRHLFLVLPLHLENGRLRSPNEAAELIVLERKRKVQQLQQIAVLWLKVCVHDLQGKQNFIQPLHAHFLMISELQQGVGAFSTHLQSAGVKLLVSHETAALIMFLPLDDPVGHLRLVVFPN